MVDMKKWFCTYGSSYSIDKCEFTAECIALEFGLQMPEVEL